jgi:hypothetical protein
MDAGVFDGIVVGAGQAGLATLEVGGRRLSAPRVFLHVGVRAVHCALPTSRTPSSRGPCTFIRP